MDLSVGSKVILLREMLNEKVGSQGIVFEIYPDFDNSSKTGVQVIFQGGNYCGFSAEEQELFFEDRGVDSRYQCYNFRNVNWVYADYRKGYWKFNE
jgi:hypothetical protein